MSPARAHRGAGPARARLAELVANKRAAGRLIEDVVSAIKNGDTNTFITGLDASTATDHGYSLLHIAVALDFLRRAVPTRRVELHSWSSLWPRRLVFGPLNRSLILHIHNLDHCCVCATVCVKFFADTQKFSFRIWTVFASRLC